MKEYKHATWNSEKGRYEGYPNNPKYIDVEGIKSLDTPFYTAMMAKEKVYEDFLIYMEALHTNPNVRPSEPTPSEELKKFYNKYMGA